MVLALFGIACGVYSTLSCEWFAWTPLDESNAWGVFAIDSTANQAESVGLFRYFFLGAGGEEDETNKDENFNNRIQTTFSCQLYADDNNNKNNDWLLLISRKTDPWMFTAQLCWVIATVLAVLSTLATIPPACCSFGFCSCFSRYFCCCCKATNGRASCCAACGWLLASGLQAASCLAATALCGGYDFWECPWLQGAHASAGAAWFYLLCWLLTVCGYRFVETTNKKNEDHRHHHRRRVTINNHHYHHHHGRQEDDHDLDLELAAAAPAAVVNDSKDDESNNTKDHKMSAEELLGTNDPIIHRAVGQRAETIREFAVAQPMEDDDDDDNDEQDLDIGHAGAETHSQNWTDESTAATPKAKNTAREP